MFALPLSTKNKAPAPSESAKVDISPPSPCCGICFPAGDHFMVSYPVEFIFYTMCTDDKFDSSLYHFFGPAGALAFH